MRKLIWLEWRKNHIAKYIRSAAIVALLLCLFILALCFLGIANDPETGMPDAAPGNSTVSAPIELFSSMSFLVFTSVMLASYIVSAYQNKTMSLMFSYPIPRRKILAAQMLAVWIFCFAALVATKLLLYSCVLLGAQFRSSSFPLDYDMASPGFYIQLGLKSASIVTTGFISLFVGLKLNSSKAAIVTSFLLIFLTQANVGDLTLAGNGAVSAALAGISLGFALLSIWQVERKDIS